MGRCGQTDQTEDDFRLQKGLAITDPSGSVLLYGTDMTNNNDNRQKSTRSALFLFMASLIWGVAFVAQRVGMDYVGPFTFNAVRNLIGALVLLPCIAFLDRIRGKSFTAERPLSGRKNEKRILLEGGIVTGSFLAVASNLQQVGIKYTTVGKAGFITAMYIVLVPLLGVFLKRRTSWKLWLSVVLAVIGLYLLSLAGGSVTLEKGDAFVLLCALAFAFQIMAVDKYAALTDGVRLACLEFAVCGLLTLFLMLIFEHPTPAAVWAARGPILYAGVLSSGVAYTFQILGQKGLNPTVASLIMSLESVISVLAGWIILGQTMSGREITGCVIMFAAIILAQI